jgi:phosphatidylinositol-3-phosphatase
MFARVRVVMFVPMIAVLTLVACRGNTAVPVSIQATEAARLPVFSHIFIIVMENKEENAIVDNSAAPYLNQLAAQFARAANFYAVQHPSLPNYIALIGGDTFGLTKNCLDCFISAPENLVTQLEAAGRSWKAYLESMPSPCFVGDAAPLYRQKHNPFIYFDSVRTNPARCHNLVPFTQFAADAQANTLPDFVWITPNMCNDMHDCAVADGDKWLQTWVPQILATPAWKNNGVLFIFFDEGKGNQGCCNYAAGGKVDALVISPLVRPGFTSDVSYDHYSVLRTIETAWGLPLLGKAGCDCTPLMSDFFTPPAVHSR